MICLTSILTFASLFFNRPKQIKFPDRNCHTFVSDRPDVSISLEAEQKLIGLEGATREEIQNLLGAPFCTLPRLSLRAEAIVERDLYPTADGDRAILAYEEGRYIGYARLSAIEKSDRPSQHFKEVEVTRDWEVQVGEKVAGYPIIGSLGDISIHVKGEVFAPTDGRIEPNFLLITENSILKHPKNCILFFSPQTPAYLIRLCGLQQYRSGEIAQGRVMGRTNGYLNISLLSFRKKRRRKKPVAVCFSKQGAN